MKYCFHLRTIIYTTILCCFEVSQVCGSFYKLLHLIYRTVLQVKIQAKIQVNCKAGWLKYEYSCYWFPDDTKTWNDAEEACACKQFHLVSIQSDAEQNFVVQNRQYKDIETWIGAHRNSTFPVEWYWPNGEVFHYINWKKDQPDMLNELCASIYTEDAGNANTWHDIPCSSEFRYVCEK